MQFDVFLYACEYFSLHMQVEYHIYIEYIRKKLMHFYTRAYTN